MLSIIFNKDKEIRLAYNRLKSDGIKNNGIIFGGMVRDEIIATYNKSLFEKYIKSNNGSFASFWDKSYHPESINRMKIPNDIDIYFNNNDDAEKFVEDIDNFNKSFGGEIIIINKPNSNALFYTIGNECIHRKIIIVLKLGKTLSFGGHKLTINIDLLINNDANYRYEPPFNSCDFTCNLFVMVKSLQSYDIRLSKNTGTPLDDLDYTSKMRMQGKIIDELLLGRIEFIRNVDSRNAEYINGFRIMKMVLRDEYKITNVLFRDFEKTKDLKELDNSTCDICMSDIDMSENEKLIEILTNKYHRNIMHRNCFVEYINREITRKYVNRSTDKIECRCSRRNPFNFKESYKFSILYN